MKGKRDRSVAALLVVDMTEERLAGLGAAGLDTVPVVNILTKRYGYRFAVAVFAHPPGAHLSSALEVAPDALVLERTAAPSWLVPLLQSKGVSSLYLCGAQADVVAQLALEALKIGVVVFVVRDAVVGVGAMQTELEKCGVNFVESQRI